MGNNSSAVKDVGISDEVDERLVSCNEEIFEDGFLKRHARDYKRIRFKKFNTRAETTGPVFGFRPHTKKVQHELMDDIATLGNDRKANAYSLEIEKRIHAIKKIHNAVRREIIRDRNRTQASANALKNRIETDAPPLPASAKIGIKTSVKMFLILIKSAQHTDANVMDDILSLLCEILDDTAPLTLIDGPNFSPDIANGLSPLLDFIRSLITNKSHSLERRAKATKVLFNVALARGSLVEFLSLCRVLLVSDQVGNARDVMGSLRYLINHRPTGRAGIQDLSTQAKDQPSIPVSQPERRHSLSFVGPNVLSSRRRSTAGMQFPFYTYDDEKKMTETQEHEDAPGIFPSSPAEIMQRCAPNLESLEGNDSIDGRLAALIVIAQIDRLSQPYARQPDEDIWNDDPNRLAVLYKPLCVDVKPETLAALSDIIDLVSPGYFSSDACPDSKYIPNMYMLVACLKILKVHLYQTVRAKLPQNEFNISPAAVDRIRKQIFRFLETSSAPRSNNLVMISTAVSDAVQSEAAQILAEAFEFFYSSVSDQVVYLGKLIDKFNSSENGQKQSLSNPEQDLLELLLSRFSSFSSGSLLLDELELACTHDPPAASSRVVMEVLKSLVSASVHEVESALKCTSKTHQESNILLILQNFQKHLLSRAGTYLVFPKDATETSNPGIRINRNSNPSPESASLSAEEERPSTNGSAGTRSFNMSPDPSSDAVQDSAGSSVMADTSLSSPASTGPNSSAVEVSSSAQPSGERGTNDDENVLEEDPEKIRISSAVLNVVWEYSKSLIDASLGVLSFAHDIIIQDQTSEGLRRVGEDVLRESLICKLTRPLIATLCVFIGQIDGSEMALKLLPSVSLFLMKCDNLWCLVREISQPEDEMSVDKKRIVQSRHPYRNNVEREEVITIKDAQQLIVTFDITKCSTQSEEDYVQLFKSPNKRDPITERLYGPADGSNWPAESIHVNGDTVAVFFHSGASGTGWGYRITVLGTVIVTPLSWLRDFTQNVSWLCGKMGASLISGLPVSPAEKELQGSVLVLFKSGVEPTHPLYPCLSPVISDLDPSISKMFPEIQNSDTLEPTHCQGQISEMAFLQSIISDTGTGQVLLSNLNTLMPDRHIVQRSILNQANKAIAGVFAVLLKHTHRVKLAMSLVSEGDKCKAPECILRLWKKAQEMKLELRSLKAQGEDIDEWLTAILNRVNFLLHIRADDGFIFESGSLADVTDTTNSRRSISSGLKGFSEHGLVSETAGSLTALTSSDEGHVGSANHFDVSEMIITNENDADSGFSSLSVSRSNSITELTGPMLMMQKTNKWTQSKVMTKLLKNTMKALRRLKELMLVRTRLASVKQDPESVLIRSVIKFIITRHVDLEAIMEGLIVQRTRAVLRVIGLHYFSILVKGVKSDGLLPELLLHFNSAFRQSPETGNKSVKVVKKHFTANIPTAGSCLIEYLSETYFDIAGSLITQPNLDDVSKLHLLDICNIEFNPQDLKLLHRIGITRYLSSFLAFPGTNRAVLDNQELFKDLGLGGQFRSCPWNIRFSSWSLFRMLAYAASSLASPPYECLDQIFNTALNQMSLIWKMRQHQQMLLAKLLSVTNENDKMTTDSSSSPINWYCRRCAFFNDQATSECEICSLTFQDNENLAKQDVQIEEFEHKGQEFVYEADFDTRGILYYLGTCGNTEPWRNPHELGTVCVTGSSQQSDSNPISAVVGRTAVRCVSQPSPNQWFAIDFLEHSIIPTHYTLRHYSSWDTEALRFWNLEGSNDGTNWITLRVHNNDRSLDKRGATHTWDIPNITDSYSHFRVYMTGLNSNEHWYLALSGFEIYGILDGDAEYISSKKQHPERSSGTSSDFWDIRDTREIEFSGPSQDKPVTIMHTNNTESWHTVKGVQAYSSGRHLIEFRVEFDGNGSNSWKFIIGVVPQRFMINNASTWIGSQGGWGYIGGLGHKNYNSSTNRPYGAAYTAGDTIGIQLDFDSGTIEFFKNGASQGIAFDNLTGPVFAAVSMTGYQSKVTMLQPPPVEEDHKIVEIDRSSWHIRIREANLGDASVYWFKNHFDDVGLRGRPLVRKEAPVVGELDAFFNQYLWLLLRCCQFPAVQRVLSSKPWIKIILEVAAHGSPVGKLLAVRICRYILPGISPSDDRLVSGSGAEAQSDAIGDGASVPGLSMNSKRTALISGFLERAAGASFHIPIRSGSVGIDGWSRQHEFEESESSNRQAAIEASLLQYKQRCGGRSGPASLSFSVKRGTIEIDGWHHLKATMGFATAVADVSVISGKWYFEAVLETAGLQQIGFVKTEFSPVGAGDGVGDDKVSWAFDGMRSKKWHDGSAPYGGTAPWKTGDVVGVLLNMDEGELRYTLCGVDLGVAFTDLKLNGSGAVFPAVSMSAGESLRFIFDSSKFLQTCPEGYYPWIGDKPTVQQHRSVPWSIESDAIGSEYVSLSRVLIRSTLWKTLFNEVLWNGLQNLSTLHSDLDSLCQVLRMQRTKDLDWNSSFVPAEFCTSLRLIVSALSVLGGNIESVRQGARVVYDSTDGQSLEGTVTSIVREPNKGSVVIINLDNGEDAVVTELVQLTARSNVELSLSHVRNPADLIKILGNFLSTSVTKHIYRFPTARQIFMQIQRQALKVLLSLFENSEFVALFIEAGFGQLIGKKALSASIPLADGLINMISNLEPRALALEKRRRELHDPECADEQGAVLRFFGDIHYSRALGQSDHQGRKNIVSFDDGVFLEQVVSSPTEARISEVCVWADNRCVYGIRASYIIGDDSTEMAPRHLGSANESSSANIVSLKSDEFIVRIETISVPLSDILPGGSSATVALEANVIATLILTTNHDSVHTFGRQTKEEDLGDLRSVVCQAHHGVVAFFGTVASHLESIGLIERPVKRVKIRHFTYQDDLDENGIVFFLGCKNGTSTFQNPMTLGLVEVTVARIKADSHHVSAVVGREAVRCLCNDMNNAWFAIDFKRYLIRPNKYTLRHYSSWDTEALRSWKFQGSVDGTDWVVLRDHVDDASLNKKGQAHSWDLPGISQFYRHFRILMTGKNSNNHNYLSLSGFEIYGDLLEEIAELRSVSCSSLDSVQCEDIQHTSEATSDDGLHNDSTIARRDGSSKGLGLSLASPSNALNIDLLNMAVAASSAQTEIEPGQVYSFGHGGSGRLGHGNNSAVQIPKLIDGFDGRLVTSISCFNQHVLALTENGQVYSWGNNQEGRLGHGDTVPVTRPKLIQALEHSICVQVCAGNSFSVVLDSDHHVWVFGKGNEGQMGNGSISDQKVPIQVKGILEFAEITRIGVGAFHCLALTASGELYSWGRNLRGQLGLNSTAKKKLMPEKVQHCPSFVEVRGGWDHSMALTSSGQLYSWGNGYEGSRPATGHGTNQNILAPKLVQALKNKVVVRISTGWDHSMALTKDGEAYLWGGNASGVLGNGTTNQESTPKLLVDEIGKEKIVWIDGAQYHTCAVTEKGELWLWGSLLGSESRVPKKVEVPYPNLFFQYVICGDKANYAVSCESPKKVPPTPVVAIGATDITYPPYPQSAFLLGPPSKFFVGFAAVKPPVIPASRAPRLDVTMLSTDGGQHSDDYKASNVFLDNEDVYCTTAKRNVNIVAEPDPAGHVIYLTAVSARNPDPETFTAPLLSALVFVLDDLSEVAATVSFDNFTAAQYSSFIAQKQSEDSEPLATEPVAFIDLSATSNAFVQCDLVRAGKYILFKLVEPRTKETNIDVEFLAAYGYLDELPLDMEHTHINDKRKSPQDALLEEDARKRQEVRNFVSDIHGVFKGPITVDEDLKLGGLYPSVTGGFSSSFSCDPEMPAPGVTICIRFKPSQNVLFSMKSYATLLSIVLPESDSSAQLLCDPTFRQFQLVISGGGLSDVSEEIIFEDMGDEWHHAVLVIDRRCLSVSEKKSICVSAFIDGALVCSLVIPTKGMRFDVANLLPLNGNASFGCGINGQIREAGIWGFALDAKQVHDLCQSSLEFCQLDFEETALHIMHVQTYRIHPKNLSAGVKLSGEAEFYQLSSDSANHTKLTDTNYALKNPSDSECFVSLLPNSGITIERSLGRKPLMDSYTLIADINIPNLPSSTDCCLIQCASAALVVKPDGRFDVLGRISGKKSTRKIFPNVWYRVVFSVDLQKGQIFVFTNGMLAASLAGDEHFLSKAGPFSLPVSFDICRGNSVPVFVRRIQLRSKPLSQSNAIRLRSADESLEDGRDINAVARSLLKMGYPMRWCTKALASNSMNRRLASDYILKNATSLHSEDRLEEHNKAAQTLSLMGFPRKLCAVALSKVMNNTSSAILYLLDNVDNFSDSELCDEECSAQGSNNLEDDAHRNLNIEKNESTNAAFKILKSTKENMEATLDELVQRSIPKRTVDYPELQTLNKNELYSAMAATEEALSITYSRRCVLSMLQNWPTSNPLSLRIFGDDEFLVKFIRLIEFSQPTDGLDVLRASLHKILEREDASISEVISASLAMKPTASNSQLGNELLSISMLKQFAPISRQLLAEALHHMVGIISDPHSKILNETDALHQPNPGLIIWILNIFTEFVQDPSLITSPGDQSREQLSVIDDDPLQSVASKTLSHLGRIVFSGPVVNLIFEVIAVSSGDQRLSFVRLLSHLIRLGIQFDSNRSCVLKDLMNHMHVAQSSKGIYSSFFQALIELNVSMEKIEQLKLQKQPSSEDDSHDEDRIGPVSHPSDLASPSLSESAVVAEDPIQQGIQFTYSEDMDANGILYYLGTNQNTTAWANPSELGVVKVTASSLMLDSKPASAVVGREAVRCVTKPMPNQWFAIDFLDHSITPTYYTLRHYSSWDTEALRSWKLEGSHDGVTWVVLREHRNDSSLARKGQTHSWPLLGIEESYSQFRIIMTDQNSNQHWYLSLSGFEIYGTLDGDALAWEEEEKEFVYASDLDTNGILYFLGTNELTDSWQNPAETGLVRVEACSLQHNSAPKSAIVGREAVRCVSQPNQDQWFVIDFLDRRIIPSKYTLRHYNSYDTEALRNWRLEGSTDGTNWVCLREHRDDCSLQKKGQTHTWDITMNQPAESYSKFRIFMFGKNSNDHWYLALSGFEIYGRMLVRTGQRTKTHQTKGKLRNKPWFESVLLVDNIVRCILCKESFPRPFSKKIWKQITSWPSEKVKISNADEDDISEFDSIMSKFSRVADEDLVHMINRLVEKSTLDPMHMKANELEVKQEDLLPYRSLEEIPLRDLQIRLFTIQQLNVQISSVMSFVDFSIPTGMSTLADGIRAIRGLIFFRTKEVLWNRALDETKCSPSDRELELDRFRAVKLRESRKMDVKGQRSLFGQAFQQLNNRDPKMFRLEKSKCAWKTVFKGEFSDDYGGPYRNSIEDFCNELHSDLLPLFIRCPNGRENIGTNREKYVPRPSSVSPLHLAMYEFVGKLMGLAIRTKNVLDLDLPSIVWKPLVSDVITEEDVLSIDLLSFKILDELKKFENSGDLPPEYFTACVNSKFVVIGSDQRIYPLVPGGHHIQVTWENRHQFSKALIHYRLNEFKIQCEAIKRGLATVVPYPLLSLFTWHELEVEVCGRPKMNIDLLEQMAIYESCSSQDPHIILFWKMLRECLDDVERCQFLRFVWGRSRLPLKQEDFDRKFKISRMHQADRSPDDYLPISHTCFFSLELPRYSSLDVMHKKILYAITHCVE